MEKKYLEAGKVNNTHALKGEVKFEHWCENDKSFKRLENLYLDDKGEKNLAIEYIRGSEGKAVVKFCGIDSVEDAVKLKGKILYASRNELDPENKKVFISELIGENMINDKTGEILGTVLGFDPRGSSGLYEIKLPSGKTAYFPIVKEFIVSVDRNDGIRVNPPEGIFD